MEATELLTGLQIGIAVVVLIILYHALFAIVSLRKIDKRAENVTKNAEELVLKPLAFVETVIETVGFVKQSANSKKKKS